MRRMVGLGECMVELSAAGDGLWRQGFAGDVFNTLWYARRALPDPWQVRFFTALGTDPISEEMALFIEDAGIACTGPRLTDRRPGLYMITLTEGERTFSYWREHSAARRLARDIRAVETAVRGAEIVYVSGITLAILPETDRAALIGVLRACRARNATIAFDPNIRPVLWPDRETMRAAITEAAGVSSIVLPGFSDESAVFGDETPAATADRYRAAGAQLVVVKTGGEAPIVVDWQGARETFAFPKVKPIDTTGAGDSFNGAFLANYAETLNPGEAVLAGHQCAAEVVLGRGALVASAV